VGVALSELKTWAWKQQMDALLKMSYDKPASADGFRVLVDRLWPRGKKIEGLNQSIDRLYSRDRL
jgi:uncharacterized protein YeaO (DUF488 family)